MNESQESALKIYNLFATPKSFKEIEEFIMRMPAGSRAEATIVAGLTWNLAVSVAQKESTNRQHQK